MKAVIRFLAIPLFLITSCSREPTDRIIGTYVRESSEKSIDLDTGSPLGTITILDTIYVSGKKGSYIILNNVWEQKNYGDQRKMERSGGGKRQGHECRYDGTNHCLVPIMSAFFVPTYLDLEKGLLSDDPNFTDPWKKVK